jgi:UDP-N-acetylmuramate: L-alanyl-gamma-D-glutamyl-meso-diaminopimelate ligase
MFSTEIKSVHFTGIGGTGMAAAAAAMQEKGFRVTGSDQNVYPPMSTFLAEKKITVMNGYDEKNLAHKPDLVVIGNAISRGNPEAEFVLDHKLRYCSLAALLAEFFIRGKRALVVTGTHGKTTTTSLLAWMFEHSGLKPQYLIGGIPTNLRQAARGSRTGDWFILEGDEYDTAFFDKRSKFLHYLPELVIINNLEFDHADIFDNLAAIQKSPFSHLVRIVNLRATAWSWSTPTMPEVDAIVAHVGKGAQGGDIVCVFSNGGFGGIHGKLLERLGKR